jgi:hypothetical protein
LAATLAAFRRKQEYMMSVSVGKTVAVTVVVVRGGAGGLIEIKMR